MLALKKGFRSHVNMANRDATVAAAINRKIKDEKRGSYGNVDICVSAAVAVAAFKHGPLEPGMYTGVGRGAVEWHARAIELHSKAIAKTVHNVIVRVLDIADAKAPAYVVLCVALEEAGPPVKSGTFIRMLYHVDILNRGIEPPRRVTAVEGEGGWQAGP